MLPPLRAQKVCPPVGRFILVDIARQVIAHTANRGGQPEFQHDDPMSGYAPGYSQLRSNLFSMILLLAILVLLPQTQARAVI